MNSFATLLTGIMITVLIAIGTYIATLKETAGAAIGGGAVVVFGVLLGLVVWIVLGIYTLYRTGHMYSMWTVAFLCAVLIGYMLVRFNVI